MSVRPGQSIAVQFPTQAADGTAVNADSTPTGTLVVNGVDSGTSVVVANVTTGVYRATVTLPTTLANGAVVQLRVAATVGGVTGRRVVWTDMRDLDHAVQQVARMLTRSTGVCFVDPVNGSESNDGLTPATSKALADVAVAAAPDGGAVMLTALPFDLAGGQLAAIASGVLVAGAGKYRTTVTSERALNDGPVVELGAGFELADMTVVNTLVADPEAPQAQACFGLADAVGSFRAEVRNVRGVADSDVFYAQVGSTSYLDMIDCDLEAKYDTVAVLNGEVHIRDFGGRLTVVGPSAMDGGGFARAVNFSGAASGGSFRKYGGTMDVRGGAQDNFGIYSASATPPTVELHGVHSRAAGGNDAADVAIVTGSAVTVVGGSGSGAGGGFTEAAASGLGGTLGGTLTVAGRGAYGVRLADAARTQVHDSVIDGEGTLRVTGTGYAYVGVFAPGSLGNTAFGDGAVDERVAPNLDAAVSEGSGLTAAQIAQALAGQIPVNLNGRNSAQHLEVFEGEAWSSTNQGADRALPFTKQASESWPATLSTVHFYCTPTGQTLEEDDEAEGLSEVACTVTQATGSARAFNLELTAAQTGGLTSNAKGVLGYTWVAVANKATFPAVIRAGTMTVRPAPDFTPAP